ncbi:MAG: SiaC family regulatory phosphoprotein [Bacteroidetes bacterium]|jgi:hypothetical protein|nr:SiaC family regulatory phosphoprotein [Bacteroidota bacterium]
MNTELFRIDETFDSPLVVIKSDSPQILLKGVSMPENSFEFYNPIENKILEFLNAMGDKVEMEVELNYLNSMSGKQILQLIKKIKAAKNNFSVLWRHKNNDDLIRIKGEDIKKICPNVMVELIAIITT